MTRRVCRAAQARAGVAVLAVTLVLALVALLPLTGATAQDRPRHSQPQAPRHAPQAQAGDDDRATKNVALLDEVLTLIRRRFYDRRLHGVDLTDLRERHVNAVRAARDKLALYDELNAMIAEFKASHMTVIDGRVRREYATGKPQPGFQLIKLGGTYYADMLYEKGPALAAGLKRGDALLAIDGVPIATCERARIRLNASDPGINVPFRYVVLFEANKTLTLSVRRTKDGAPRDIRIIPAPTGPLAATRASVRVMTHDGKKFGVFHAWNFSTGAISLAFYDALRRFEREGVDGLMLDVRGRGGSVTVIEQMLAPFHPEPDDGKTARAFRFAMGRGRGNAPHWAKPAVLLVDEHSRSAKDVYAHVFKRDQLAPLVGRPTSGAVLATRYFPLSDGGSMMLPIQDVTNMLIDHVRLEGKPVVPNIRVKPALAFAQGKDEIFDAGLIVLANAVKQRAGNDAHPEDF